MSDLKPEERRNQNTERRTQNEHILLRSPLSIRCSEFIRRFSMNRILSLKEKS
jgi:hypothetical protein